MILPTIHMNGTSAEELRKGYLEAWRAINAAREEMGKIEFNARDYYPQGHEAWKQARAEHEARLRKLTDTADELMDILEVIQSAIDAKRAK